jgi:AcrR family transcriptional regulator
MKRDDRSSQEGSEVEGIPVLSNREKILHATVQVAIRDGVMAMTLDAVAQEAGVSKGGLLYHFRSKDDLIAAMLVHFSTKVKGQLDEKIASDPKPRGRFIRAMVETVFPRGRAGDAGASIPSETSRFFMAIVATAANNPRLLDPIRRNAQQMRELFLAEGPNGLRQLALRAAIDGLMLWEHLGLISRDDPLYPSILDELLTLAEGPDPSDNRE